jgi:signal transduction histidine kinase
VHPDDRATVAALWHGLQAPSALRGEEFRVLPATALRWVRDRLFPVRDARDEVYRVARVTSDITRRKEMERLLRAADSNKNEFLATLAHELRNPLSPIRNAPRCWVDRRRGRAPGARARSSRARSTTWRTWSTTCSTWRAFRKARSCCAGRGRT